MEKRKWRFLALMLAGVLLCGCASAPPASTEAPETLPEETLEDFSMEDLQAFTGGNVEIRYSPETGLPKEITGRFSPQQILTAEDAIRSLGSVKTLFGIESLTFSCTEVEERPDSRVFRLEQLWEGIPVSGYGFQVGAANDGTALFVSGNYCSAIQADLTGGLTEDACKEALALSKGEKAAQARQTILTTQDGAKLCWEFHIVAQDPLQERLVYCDASTGAILKTIPLAMG